MEFFCYFAGLNRKIWELQSSGRWTVQLTMNLQSILKEGSPAGHKFHISSLAPRIRQIFVRIRFWILVFLRITVPVLVTGKTFANPYLNKF
jgi:hypothetical protein